jgi:hypothetical protein
VARQPSLGLDEIDLSTGGGRLEIAASHMEMAGKFEHIRGGFANPERSPPGGLIFSVVSNKAASPERPASP